MFFEKPLPKMELVRSLMYQLFRGIAYCHHKFVLHRDLKPQNLLINRKGELKIADFGLARSFGAPVRSYSHEVVTLWYRSPDVLLGSKYYSTTIDIWSIGCIFAELVLNKPIFPGSGTTDQLHRIQRILGTPTTKDWPGLAEFPDGMNQANWINSKPLDLAELLPSLDPLGIDLLQRCFKWSPELRISAEDALSHPYFDSVRT